MFEEKFEIPLTTINTEAVFDNIRDNSKYINFKLIQGVYAPVHAEDGGSARPFKYDYNQREYYDLIERLSRETRVVITFPYGDADTIRKYAELGARKFMVSEWREEYRPLQEEGVEIVRSIVGNAYNTELDERFGSMVVPYRYMLNIDRLKELSKKFKLTIIPDHFCKVNCRNLDAHCQHHIKKENRYTKNFNLPCPEGRSFFIPREVLVRLLPYVDTVKLVGRFGPPDFYENRLNYYVYGEPLDTGRDNRNYQPAKIANKYSFSNLVSLRCEFECHKCTAKCF